MIQDDDNKYVIVRSKFTDFNNSKFLDRVNALIKNGYQPQGGVSSGDGYTFQALYRENWPPIKELLWFAG